MVPPDQCRCAPPVVGPLGLVYEVSSCPVCIGGALKWFGYQLELFSEEGESVSVSAVLASEKYEKQYAEVNDRRSDDLPF